MAIVQISRITHRKGLQENLPQLAGAELGWSVDSRRLFIGNGTIAEGAPAIGNTEILTEYSDILNFSTNYTYKGNAAGYTVNDAVSVSMQSWFDQWASVLDFGATGDGATDDTAAIHNAIYEIYCREVNPQIRRALFFPAGVYVVSETINIPPYATLYGEGPENSIIQLVNTDFDSALKPYVARTCDSLNQTGLNIGTNGAIPPQSITVRDMGFQNLDPDTDIMLIEDASDCSFINASFNGPLTTLDLTNDASNSSCIRFASTASIVTQRIKFDQCLFTGTVWGFNTDQQIEAVTVTESKFKTLYQGIVLGIGTPVLGGATGFRVSHSSFDTIYAEGIIFGDVSLNVSDFNIFYDVGNEFGGTTNPQFTIIDLQSANNLSIGDMFQRTLSFSLVHPRINVNKLPSIGFLNSERLILGTYNQSTGSAEFTLNDNEASFTPIVELVSSIASTFTIKYKITRNGIFRTGELNIAGTDGVGTLAWTDDYSESGSTGVSLSVIESGGDIIVGYTSTSTGFTGKIVYINSFFED